MATSRLDQEDTKWGAGCLLDIMDALRQQTRTEGYGTYVLDAEDVLDGLGSILAADIVEGAVEDAIAETLEDET